MTSALTIDFAPLLPDPALYVFAAASLALLGLSLFLYRRGMTGRALCSAAFILLFLNPSAVEEQREPVSDIAVIAVDRSPSQQNGKRTERTDEALAWLRQEIDGVPGLELRIVSSDGGPQRETRLFETVDNILSDVPVGQRAGVIMLTDGQIHDMPQDGQRLTDYGPIHALISGDRNERDRQLVILEAPSYGIVGQTMPVRFRIEDNRPGGDTHATVLIRQDNNSEPRIELMPLNEDLQMTVTIDHAGQNVFDIDVSGVDDEITLANNRVPIIINGVRDRLRVLLVSGQPHAGGRTWRNMLTSDPGVDLVHFTILREPDKLDATPQNELSLIAFPFEELFETKLYDFDLIIFDRYRLNRILPNYYFGNIARYVKEGGALLEVSGPSFATENSIYTTELQQVLPAFPTGQVIEKPFKPVLTATGSRHPVTQSLHWKESGDGTPGWGQWLRQISVSAETGETLMTGIGGLPLLILDHVGKGRVAQLASDQIWLWSRGFEGGGPHAEMLRRMAHWLMKEPELEENALDVSAEDGALLIRRRSLSDTPIEATVTAPDGTKETAELLPDGKGLLEARISAQQLGVYTVNDGGQERFAMIGDINPPELREVLSTEDKVAAAVDASRGGIVWLEKTQHPDIHLLPADRDYGGNGWIGLKQSRSYSVTGIKTIPFLPEWLYALSLLALVIGSWWIEGKKKS